jgi:hypothetical protein
LLTFGYGTPYIDIAVGLPLEVKREPGENPGLPRSGKQEQKPSF